LISRSHIIGRTIQEIAHERGRHRGEATAATVLEWARAIHPDAEMIRPEMRDGDAIFFDGRLWHGSENTREHGTRTALLFQYAAAGQQAKMPDFSHLEWPFRYQSVRVPVLLVSGRDSSRANHLVVGPKRAKAMESQFHSLYLPLPQDADDGWLARHLFAGATPNLSRMNAHVSVLSAGHSPHPPHAHRQEEILIVLDGEAELVIARARTAPKRGTSDCAPGRSFIIPHSSFTPLAVPGSRPSPI
jgi:Phytanoyl-CoA dioxygenase (PhyH)